MVVHVCNPSISEAETSLDYIASSRPAWATERGPVSTQNKKIVVMGIERERLIK
jgi:hypothetical protein